MTWFLLTLALRSGTADTAVSAQASNLAARAGEVIGRALTTDDFRDFPAVAIAAVRGPEGSAERLRALPGVLAVVDAAWWYMNLIEAWAHVIGRAASFQASVVNLSLVPPSSAANNFDPDEPLNRATRVAHDHGIITVVAAGNEGRHGTGTMSRWAMAPWVISVGASDLDGRAVEPYSSRGVPATAVHPVVVAPGMQEPPTGDFGTSFAAPVVTDVAAGLMAFLLELWMAGGQPLATLTTRLPEFVRRALERMARPIAGDLHERGAGFVNKAVLLEFLLGLMPEEGRSLFETGPWLDARVLARVQALAATPGALERSHRVGRFRIDSRYEWTGPAYVPGLLRYDNCFLLRMNDTFADYGSFRTASVPHGNAEFVEISILPAEPRERRLIVRQDGSGDFRTITSALLEARDDDVIQIGPGLYEETLRLPSRIVLLGEAGAVIRHASAPPIAIDHGRGAALVGLRIEASGPRCPAVRVMRGASIAFRRCRLVSESGNAVDVSRSQRFMFSECALEGGVNAAFVLFSREGVFERTMCVSAHSGVLLYGSSGRFIGGQVIARDGDGVTFIAPHEPWTDRREASVYTHPVGFYQFDPADVGPEAVGRADLAGSLATHLYALQIRQSTLRASRAALAATDLRLVRAERCVVEGGGLGCAMIRGKRALPVRDATGEPWARVLEAVTDSLSPVEYTPCIISGLEQAPGAKNT